MTGGDEEEEAPRSSPVRAPGPPPGGKVGVLLHG